jgi:hypothetical protein
LVIAGLDPAIYPLKNEMVWRSAPADQMQTSTTTKSYRDWRIAVDQRLYEIYCLTIEDAGFDEEYLATHWQSNEQPADFVEWFGDKYDFDPRQLLIPSLRWGS